MAVSTAVEPPVVKNTLFKSPGDCSASLLDNIADCSVVDDQGLENDLLMVPGVCGAPISAMVDGRWQTRLQSKS